MTLIELQTAFIFAIVFILIITQHLVKWGIRESWEWGFNGIIVAIIMIDLALIAWSVTTLINLCVK